MNILQTLAFALIILTTILGALLIPYLPDQIPSHWNIAGEVDATMPLIPGLFFIPLLMIGITALMMILPRFDPRRERYKEFQTAYDGLILLLNLFFFVIFMATILWAIGIEFSINQIMSLLCGLLFGGIGFFMRDVKPNWFAGIRTPWTMESETVWNKTHEQGFYVFLGAGVISLIGLILPLYAFFLILFPIIVGSLYLVVFSYLTWREEQKNQP